MLAIAYFYIFATVMFIAPVLGFDRFLLKVSGAAYSREVMENELKQAYIKRYSAPSGNTAERFAAHLLDNLGHKKKGEAKEKDERDCIRNSNVKFYLEGVYVREQEHEASECRINLHPKYAAVIAPSFNIHETIHTKTQDSLLQDLEDQVVEKFKSIPALSQYRAYDLSNLNEDLQCFIQYKELGQVKLKETVIVATIEKLVLVAPSCGFQLNDESFPGEVKDSLQITIPVGGFFYCKTGRSPTCKTSKAESSYARYKLLETM